ncbi:FAD-binding oxidoreductase [Chitinibacter bivalviorum]|uniref:FAD-binding oxidoreductase n=1 Tax=Chitinibacter bivalviorum TaxID=2739434 RepID=A0A7H9BLG6_9NEIS|nr:FAD-binding oxidoreductase [Chitinibacter bivalviorum]QLG89252.1 FAD-binding oxidoreductase [Chitinibacter bivalviorum]
MTFLEQLNEWRTSHSILFGADTAPYCLDQRRRYQGRALAVARPNSTEQVQQLVRLCAEHQIAIVPQGGNTSLCGAATPLNDGQSIVISFERMTQIVQVDADNNTITVQAGVTLAQVQQAALAAKRLFPANWAAAQSCQIGGALATNAGGVNVLRYGNMRELTLGLEVVLADGELWEGLRGLRKDNTGYDLKQLFVGSEGTLGLITQAVLRLYPLPTAHATALVAVESPAAAVDLLRGLQAEVGDRVTSFELISAPCLDLLHQHFPRLPQPFQPIPAWCVLIELSDGGDSALLTDRLAEYLYAHGCMEAYVAQSPTEAADFWRLRESIPEAQRIDGVSIKHDISLPIGAVPDFLQKCDTEMLSSFAGARIVAFGHLGDGNLHYNLFLADKTAGVYALEPAVNDLVYRHVAAYNGSISAEHGIGQLKRATLQDARSDLELHMMRQIKATLDPLGLFNPGKVL